MNISTFVTMLKNNDSQSARKETERKKEKQNRVTGNIWSTWVLNSSRTGVFSVSGLALV